MFPNKMLAVFLVIPLIVALLLGFAAPEVDMNVLEAIIGFMMIGITVWAAVRLYTTPDKE